MLLRFFLLLLLFSPLFGCDWGVSKRMGEEKTVVEGEVPEPPPTPPQAAEAGPHPECPNLPADLPITKAPIPMEWSPFNLFLSWKTDPGSFASYMEELKAYPPKVISANHQALVPFLWGSWKSPLGGIYDLYGEWTGQAYGQVVDAGRLPPEQLKERMDALKEYLKVYEGVTKYMPYTDFGTQLFGNHVTRTGFWEVYDHWNDYAALFDLGPKPPDPTTWLRRWYNNEKQYPAYMPDELVGYSFSYGPAKCAFDSQECRKSYLGGTTNCSLPEAKLRPANCSKPTYYRYAVNILSKGWEMWWKMVFQQMAKLGYPGAFIDNVYFGACWNDECQDGFRKWVEKNFSAEQIQQFFFQGQNLYGPLDFEWGWTEENGNWKLSFAAANGGKIFPDTDSYSGLYAARFEGVGSLEAATATLPPEKANRDFTLKIHYKTAGDAKVTAVVDQIGTPIEEPLPQAAGWTERTLNFHIPSTSIRVWFKIESQGPQPPIFWVDAVQLQEAGSTSPPFPSITLFAPDDQWNFTGRLRTRLSVDFFNSVVDDRVSFLRQAAREINPNFEIFTNSYHPIRGADYFMIEGQANEFEVYRRDVSLDPGIYRPAPAGEEPYTLKSDPATGAPLPVTSEIVMSNIFDYKYVHSRRFPDFFSTVMHHQTPGGANYLHNVDSALLRHAEDAAFGGGAGVDLELRALYPYYPDAAHRTALREVGKNFFKFVDSHRDLYECLRSHADVALIFHDVATKDDQGKILDIAQGLASRGILWDVIAEDKRVTPTNLARYKAVVYHAVQRMPEAEAQALVSFLQSGGVVVASGKVGELDEFMRLRAGNRSSAWPPVPLHATQAAVYPVGAGKLISAPAGLADLSFALGEIETHLKRPLSVFSNLSGRALERARTAAWEGNNRLVLHLVNYDVPLGKENANQVAPLSNVEVRIKLPGSWTPSSVTLYSPEPSGSSGAVPLTKNEDGTISFTVPSLRIYEAAVIE